MPDHFIDEVGGVFRNQRGRSLLEDRLGVVVESVVESNDYLLGLLVKHGHLSMGAPKV